MNKTIPTYILKINILLFFLILLPSNYTHTVNIRKTFKIVAKISISTLVGTIITTPIILYLMHNNTSLPYKNIIHPWNNLFTAEKHIINNQYYYHLQRKNITAIDNYSDTLFVHLHEIGDHPLALACIQDGPLFPSNNYYAICFEDATQNKLFKSSFGQKTDIISVLTILQYISKNYSSIRFIAHSRGAAALINSIAVLTQPNHELLTFLDISELERIALLKKIKNGAIVLKAPLIHTKNLVKNALGYMIGGIIEKTLLSPLSGFRYISQGPQAINSLKHFYYLSIPTLICFPTYDQILENSMNESFIKKFTHINGKENTSTCVYDGDHIGSSSKQFQDTVYCFLKNKQTQ